MPQQDPNALSAAAGTVTKDPAALDKALAAFNPGPKCCKVCATVHCTATTHDIGRCIQLS